MKKIFTNVLVLSTVITLSINSIAFAELKQKEQVNIENVQTTLMSEAKEEIAKPSAADSVTINSTNGLVLSKESGDYAKSHAVTIISTTWTNIQSAWSTSSQFPTSGFVNRQINTTLYTPNETGNYYLHLKGMLNGKEQRYTSGIFKVDTTAPSLTVSKETTNWTNNLKLTATGSDSHSGIDLVYLKSNETDKNILSLYELQYWGGENHNRSGLKVRFKNDASYRGGVFIPAVKFEPNQNYVLSFKIRKLSGNLPYIGGHLHISNNTEVYLDGKRVYAESQGEINDWSSGLVYPNDNQAHEIVVKFKTNRYDVPSDKTVHIQPNRKRYEFNYEVEIFDIQLEKGTEKTPYEPNSADLITPTNPFNVNVTKNGTYTFVAVDKAGNMTEKSITVNNIDTEHPSLSITPSTTELTHEDITLTVVAQDTGGSGVKRIKTPDGKWINGNLVTYTVKENGTYTFVVEDNAGNQTSKSITVNNIDKSISIEKPTIAKFSDITLPTQYTVVSTDISPLVIQDWRDTSNDWKLRISATPLTKVDDNYQIPSGSIRIKPISQITKIEGNGTLPNKKISSTQIIDNSAVDLLEGINSKGKFQVTFPSNSLELLVDPTVMKVGNYKTTITWELVFGP